MSDIKGIAIGLLLVTLLFVLWLRQYGSALINPFEIVAAGLIGFIICLIWIFVIGALVGKW